MHIYDISCYFGTVRIVSQVIWYLIYFTFIYNLYFCWLQYPSFIFKKNKSPTKQTKKPQNTNQPKPKLKNVI